MPGSRRNKRSNLALPETVPLVLLVFACVVSSGCALFLVGAGAAGGYAVSKDSIKNSFDLPKKHVFRHSVAAVKEAGGRVTIEDPANGVIRAVVGETNVTLTVKSLTRKTVELKVKARNKFLLPDMEVAQEVYNKILARLQ
ncbi:MAG: hypothetical protein HY594_04100 [Candidatus Omnitrophica bacterium]|nr:hypothetical protein [Candidatus Omnitrophota bacterium]